MIRAFLRDMACAFFGHDFDYSTYVPGSYELICRRCQTMDWI